MPMKRLSAMAMENRAALLKQMVLNAQNGQAMDTKSPSNQTRNEDSPLHHFYPFTYCYVNEE